MIILKLSNDATEDGQPKWELCRVLFTISEIFSSICFEIKHPLLYFKRTLGEGLEFMISLFQAQ
jgi:hypothetical protein